MINYILDVMLCGGVVLIELIGVLTIAMLIQGIVYWTTGFSIYKYFLKNFN